MKIAILKKEIELKFHKFDKTISFVSSGYVDAAEYVSLDEISAIKSKILSCMNLWLSIISEDDTFSYRGVELISLFRLDIFRFL